MVLKNNRSTPQTKGVAPRVVLLNRPVCNKLPQDNHVDPVSGIVRERASSQKLKFKVLVNRKVYVKRSAIYLSRRNRNGQEAIYRF